MQEQELLPCSDHVVKVLEGEKEWRFVHPFSNLVKFDYKTVETIELNNVVFQFFDAPRQRFSIFLPIKAIDVSGSCRIDSVMNASSMNEFVPQSCVLMNDRHVYGTMCPRSMRCVIYIEGDCRIRTHMSIDTTNSETIDVKGRTKVIIKSCMLPCRTYEYEFSEGHLPEKFITHSVYFMCTTKIKLHMFYEIDCHRYESVGMVMPVIRVPPHSEIEYQGDDAIFTLRQAGGEQRVVCYAKDEIIKRKKRKSNK